MEEKIISYEELLLTPDGFIKDGITVKADGNGGFIETIQHQDEQKKQETAIYNGSFSLQFGTGDKIIFEAPVASRTYIPKKTSTEYICQ